MNQMLSNLRARDLPLLWLFGVGFTLCATLAMLLVPVGWVIAGYRWLRGV